MARFLGARRMEEVLMDGCQHKYRYQGVKFTQSYNPRPGSSSHDRSYYDYWFCESCGDQRYEKLFTTDTTYEPVKFMATPMNEMDHRNPPLLRDRGRVTL